MGGANSRNTTPGTLADTTIARGPVVGIIEWNGRNRGESRSSSSDRWRSAGRLVQHGNQTRMGSPVRRSGRLSAALTTESPHDDRPYGTDRGRSSISGLLGPETVSSRRGRSVERLGRHGNQTRRRSSSRRSGRLSPALTTSSGFQESVIQYMGQISGVVGAPVGLIIASVFSAFSAAVAHGAAEPDEDDEDDYETEGTPDYETEGASDYETEGTSLVVLIMQLAVVFAAIVALFYALTFWPRMFLMMPDVIEYTPGQIQSGAVRPSVNQGFGKDATTTTGESARRSIDEMRAYLSETLTGFLKFNDESGSRFKFRRVCTEVMCRLLEVKVHTANGIAGAMREWPCVSALAVAALTDTYQSVGSLLVTFHKNGEHEVPSAKGSKPMQKRYFLLETKISKMNVPVSVEVPLRESKVLQLIYLLDSYGAVFAGDKATIEAFNKGLSRALQQPNHADGGADPVLVMQKILGWLGVTADAHDVRLASNGAYKTKANKETKEAKEAKEIILSAVSLYFRGIRKGPEHGPPALLLLLKQGA